MFRVFFCAIAYALVGLILLADPSAGRDATLTCAHLMAGPALIAVHARRFARPAVPIVLFVRALSTVVLAYPRLSSYGSTALLLSIFAAESVIALGKRWKFTYLYLAFILAFMATLPRRAFGVPTPRIDDFVAAILCAYAIFAVIALHKLERGARDLRESRDALKKQSALMDQIYALNAEFQDYASVAGKKSAEEERRRITRDIHDIMGYSLVNLRVMLEVALDLAGEANPKLSSTLKGAIAHTQDSLKSARMALRNLRTIEDAAEFWVTKMNRIVTTFSSTTGIPISVSWSNVTKSNCPYLKSAVYQFVQEALTNAFKHGRARSISVEFRVVGAAPEDRLVARVLDDGIGAGQVTPGIGFDGMRERVEQLDGETGYRNLEDGFEVWISIPMLSMRKDA